MQGYGVLRVGEFTFSLASAHEQRGVLKITPITPARHALTKRGGGLYPQMLAYGLHFFILSPSDSHK